MILFLIRCLSAELFCQVILVGHYAFRQFYDVICCAPPLCGTDIGFLQKAMLPKFRSRHRQAFVFFRFTSLRPVYLLKHDGTGKTSDFRLAASCITSCWFVIYHKDSALDSLGRFGGPDGPLWRGFRWSVCFLSGPSNMGYICCYLIKNVLFVSLLFYALYFLIAVSIFHYR